MEYILNSNEHKVTNNSLRYFFLKIQLDLLIKKYH